MLRSSTTAQDGAAREAAPSRSGAVFVRWARSGGVSALLFTLPILIIFGIFSWWPILRSLILSVQRTNLVQDAQWVGLDNFARVLADPLLGTAIGNTALYAALSVVIGFPIPVLFAVVISEFRRTRGFATALAYLPVIIPPVVGVLLWKAFFDPSSRGLFNIVFGWVGLGPFPWLQSADSAMLSLVLQTTWSGMGTATIIYIAALASVPQELYEAAAVDGAKIGRRFWHITLPQLRGIMLIMLLLQLIGVFQLFTEPFIMTGGGPTNSTLTILMLIYRYAFIAGDYGAATALSLLLAVFLGIVSAIYLRLTRSWSSS